MSHLWPVSTTEFNSSIVLANNAVHVGYDPPFQSGNSRSRKNSGLEDSLPEVVAGSGDADTPLRVYPDVIRRRKHIPSERISDVPSLSRRYPSAEDFAIKQLFEEPQPCQKPVTYANRAFLTPPDMIGSPTSSGSTGVPDGAFDYSGDTSIVNERVEISTKRSPYLQIPPPDRAPSFKAPSQVQPPTKTFANPALEVLERFTPESVPHVTVSFSSSEEEATKQVLGELRSFYIFVTPELVSTLTRMISAYRVSQGSMIVSEKK